MIQKSLYDLSVRRLDGSKEPLAEYRGRVALVVNTASRCGYTPQYAGLQRLYDRYKNRNFVVLAFPCNDFGEQEPGAPQEIADFCNATYGVNFPIFEKVHTRGANQSEVYAFLGEAKGEPRWNFHKYLVDRKGAVIAAFPSSAEPEGRDIEQAIEQLLTAS